MIRRCSDHGYVDAETCPACGVPGDPVLAEERRVRLSKFCSGALRHFPDDVGIDLDRRGWTNFDDLVAAAADRYPWADREAVEAVVATDPKGRFEWKRGGSGGGKDERDDDDRTQIRAAYGHSVNVDLEPGDGPVPDRLYHGTAPRNLDAIRKEGLRPMSRQQVHLSGTVETAREVGRRHAAAPIVLVVDAARLQATGHRIEKRGAETYTVDCVPPEYLDRYGQST